ncbi:MAG: hypothetical protein WA002_04430, partial [Candidatus Acidiferrales bacterium]
MKRWMILTVCTLAFSVAASAQRLPDNVIPESYELTFMPDLAKATFAGSEVIHVRLRKPAVSIVLNSAEIEFQDVTIRSGNAAQKAAVAIDLTAEQ